MRRAAVVAAVGAVCVVTVGCGGDDVDTSANENQIDVDTTGTADTPVTADTTGTAGADTSGQVEAPADPGVAADEGAASDAGLGACPDLAGVSAAYGAEMVFDETMKSSSPSLVFCPYDEVVAPDDTTAFGTQRSPDFFSVTLTSMDITADQFGESVPGLGERAFWSEGAGELVVWTGEFGVIVSMPFAPATGDARTISINIAALVPGVDAG